MEPLTLGGSSNFMVHPDYREEQKGGGGRGSKGKGGEERMMKYLQEGSKGENTGTSHLSQALCEDKNKC